MVEPYELVYIKFIISYMYIIYFLVISQQGSLASRYTRRMALTKMSVRDPAKVLLAVEWEFQSNFEHGAGEWVCVKDRLSQLSKISDLSNLIFYLVRHRSNFLSNWSD